MLEKFGFLGFFEFIGGEYGFRIRLFDCRLIELVDVGMNVEKLVFRGFLVYCSFLFDIFLIILFILGIVCLLF